MADVPPRPPASSSTPPSPRPGLRSFGMLVEPAYQPSRWRVVAFYLTAGVALALAALQVVLDEVTGPAPWNTAASLVVSALLLVSFVLMVLDLRGALRVSAERRRAAVAAQHAYEQARWREFHEENERAVREMQRRRRPPPPGS